METFVDLRYRKKYMELKIKDLFKNESSSMAHFYPLAHHVLFLRFGFRKKSISRVNSNIKMDIRIRGDGRNSEMASILLLRQTLGDM